MESTGVFWKPIWNILEGSCTLTLANPARIKNVPGKETDYIDAEWIARLHRSGLIEQSFIPGEAIRDLRDVTRYRRKLLQNVTQEKNRIHKILQDANLKLTTYMSDVFGVSGRLLLETIVNGEVLTEQQVREMVMVKKRKKNKRGNRGLKSVRCQCSWAAIRKKDSRIAALYYRLVKRMGKQKAIMGVAHLLIRIIYSVLRDKVSYQELGSDYLGSREKNVDYWIRKIKQMGYEVELQELKPAQ
ncbi:transposase [Paenibacillus sp. IB182496]|uniref:Transposase n=2 Tax=Paenibacillus sabuli TaxID=2772509 RepID=A0A927GR76_9BACL|nr:transposase [Paenibacillus sabuli]